MRFLVLHHFYLAIWHLLIQPEVTSGGTYKVDRFPSGPSSCVTGSQSRSSCAVWVRHNLRRLTFLAAWSRDLSGTANFPQRLQKQRESKETVLRRTPLRGTGRRLPLHLGVNPNHSRVRLSFGHGDQRAKTKRHDKRAAVADPVSGYARFFLAPDHVANRLDWL